MQNRKELKAALSLAKLKHQAENSELSKAAVEKAQDALDKYLKAEASGVTESTSENVSVKEKTAAPLKEKAPAAGKAAPKKEGSQAVNPPVDSSAKEDTSGASLEAIQAAAQSAEGSADRADESAERSDSAASDAEDFAGQAEDARDIAVDAAEKAQAASEVAKKN